jgi:ankyrin repeat protein
MEVLFTLGGDMNTQGGDGHAPLMAAARHNRAVIISHLVRLGAEVNLYDPHGSTAVHVAAALGHKEALSELFHQGADILRLDANCHTPAEVARCNGRVMTVRLRAEVELDVIPEDINRRENTERGDTILFKAAEKNQCNLIRQLVRCGADVNKTNVFSGTAMHDAANNGCVGAIRVLAELGASVHSRDSSSETPMHDAIRGGHLDAIRVLAGLGAGLNSNSEHGGNAVHLAWNLDVLRLVIELGSDIHLGDYNHDCYLSASYRMEEHEDASKNKINFLVSLGADVKGVQEQAKYEIMRDDNERISRAEGAAYWGGAAAPVPARKRSMIIIMLDEFREQAHAEDSADICSLFSLTKLMSSVMASGRERAAEGHSSGSCSSEEASADVSALVMEAAVVSVLRDYFCFETVHTMQMLLKSTYCVRKRLCCLAWQEYNRSLEMDGERITLRVKARRYVELVCFFLDEAMLTDVYSLRRTCKANSDTIRRFPVFYSSCYRELEANLIEGFLAHDACRFASTVNIRAALQVHGDVAGLYKHFGDDEFTRGQAGWI